MEPTFVENWLRRDPVRWLSGALAGLFSAILTSLLAMILASSSGLQSGFPLKLFGTILIGPVATDIHLSEGAVSGAILFGILCIFLGIVFAHFVYTNSIPSLLAMGLVWGIFSWIFIWNLFMQSFKPIFAAQIPSTAVFPVCILFGLALASVSFFDRIFRGR